MQVMKPEQGFCPVIIITIIFLRQAKEAALTNQVRLCHPMQTSDILNPRSEQNNFKKRNSEQH